MSAVAVHIDAAHFLGVNIASDVSSAVDHKDRSALLCLFMCVNRAVKAGTDDEIIVTHYRLTSGVEYLRICERSSIYSIALRRPSALRR